LDLQLLVVLEEDGFGKRQFFEACVAVCKETNETIGYALYFFVYSTWQGKSLYLEDVYVQPNHRKQGVGLAFFRYVAQVRCLSNYPFDKGIIQDIFEL